MRVLIAHPGPSWSVADVYTGWAEALLGLGVEVFPFNLDDRLTFYTNALLPTEDDGKFRKALQPDQAIQLAVNGLAASLFKVRPHVLLSISSFFCDLDLLDQARRLGTTVVLLHTESPYEDNRQLRLAEHADLNLINDPTNIERFRAAGPTVYMPHAYRPGVHHSGPGFGSLAADLTFVGTGFPSRIEFLRQMDLSGLRVRLAGNWRLAADTPLADLVANEFGECLDNTAAADLYRSARCGLNLYRREAEGEHLAAGWAMGPREVEQAACGLFFLRDPRPESDEVLGMLPSFSDPGEASELLRYWLPRETERAELAMKAQAAIAERTFTHHAAELLRLIDKE